MRTVIAPLFYKWVRISKQAFEIIKIESKELSDDNEPEEDFDSSSESKGGEQDGPLHREEDSCPAKLDTYPLPIKGPVPEKRGVDGETLRKRGQTAKLSLKESNRRGMCRSKRASRVDWSALLV